MKRGLVRREVSRLLLEEESGQGLVEYGLVIVLISLAAVTALGALGNGAKNFFEEVPELFNN